MDFEAISRLIPLLTTPQQRVSAGSNQDLWRFISDRLQQAAISDLEFCTIARLLRVLVAEAPINTEIAISVMGIDMHLMQALFRPAVSVKSQKIAFQALSNMATGHVGHRARVYETVFKCSLLWDLFQAQIDESLRALLPVLTLIAYTCVSSDETAKRSFVNEPIRLMYTNALLELLTEDTDSLIIWSKIHSNIFIEHPEGFCKLLEAISTSYESILVLLKLLDIQNELVKTSEEMFLECSMEVEISLMSFNALATLFQALVAAIVVDDAQLLTTKLHQSERIVDSIILLVELFCFFSEPLRKFNVGICKIIVHNAIRLLTTLDKWIPRIDKPLVPSQKLGIIPELFLDVKRQIIRLVSHLTYQSFEMQEYVREIDALAVVLNHCNIDEYNPYILEWSVFCVRNLCENNAENQRFIDSMQNKGVATDNAVLAEMGLEARLDSDTCQLKYCKK